MKNEYPININLPSVLQQRLLLTERNNVSRLPLSY